MNKCNNKNTDQKQILKNKIGGKSEKGKFFVEEKKTKQENIWRRKCKTEKEKEENIWRRKKNCGREEKRRRKKRKIFGEG